MDFKIHSESETKPSRRGNQPPNYSSAAWRLRLATLVAALGLVLVAMNEAGKPETWSWMGFDAAQADDSSFSTGKDEGVDLNLEATANINPYLLSDLDSALTNSWTNYFQSLDKQKQKSLIPLFGIGSEPAATESDSTPLKNFVDAYIQKHPGLADNDVEQLRKSTTDWQQLLAGDLSSDDDSIQNIRQIFERALFDLVEDRSAMNRSVESAAWNLTWNKLEHTRKFTSVSYLQIAGQPEIYRGQPIRIAGSLRGLQKIDLPANHELGLDSYKVLWIKPADSGHVPYCVFASDLPVGFPLPEQGLVELSEDVSVDGIFFKLRSYVAQNDRVEICPLIVAKSIHWSVKPAQVNQTAQPPAWLLIAFLTGMPVLAALLAWRVYQATSTSSVSKIGANDDNAQTWNQLATCSDIKSDLEKVNELYPGD